MNKEELQKLKLNLDIHTDTFYLYGYPEILSNKASMVYLFLIQRAKPQVNGLEMRYFPNGEFYVDWGYGKKDNSVANEVGMHRNSAGEAIKELVQYGLIRVDIGKAYAGISTIYIKIEIPVPKQIKIPQFYLNLYDSVEEKVKRREKVQRRSEFLRNLNDIFETVDYSKEDINNYKIHSKDSDQKRRRKIQDQYIITLLKIENEITEQQAIFERDRITRLIAKSRNPYLVEDAIHKAYDEKIEDIYGFISNEVNKNIVIDFEVKKQILKNRSDMKMGKSDFKSYIKTYIEESNKTVLESLIELLEELITGAGTEDEVRYLQFRIDIEKEKLAK
ncbi:hypothetical protein NSS82_19195 [Paenibacillus sp. FSL H7-0735]|uniref:hypothetical protein n=1 Tax=Paenibacillus sp. FSL H7-0735 TaxID=2954736 RepID=UPI0030F63BF0